MKKFLLLCLSLILVAVTGYAGTQMATNTTTSTPAGTVEVQPTSTPALQDDVWTSYTNDNFVNCLESEGDIVWAGTNFGVVLLNPEKGTYIKYTQLNSGLVSNTVRAIAVDKEGNKWFGTPNGVCKFDGINWINYTTGDGLVSNSIRCIAIDTQDNKWFGTGSGISKFDGNSWTTYNAKNGLLDNDVKCIYEAADGDIWIGSDQGVTAFDGNNWTSYSSQLYRKSAECIAEDNDGNIWIGTTSYIYVFDGNTFRECPPSDGVGGYWFSDIAVDAKGNVWVGCIYRGGVSVFDGKSWKAYSMDDGMGWDWVSCLDIDADGNVWVGHIFGWGMSTLYGKKYTGIGGVEKFDGSTWTSYTIPGGPENNYVSCVAIDPEGNKWFGTGYGSAGGGLCVFDGETWDSFVSPYLLEVLSIRIDSKGNEWLSIDDYGLVVFSKGSIRATYSVGGDSDSNSVSDIEIDGKGNIWVGNEYSVSMFDGHDWVRYPDVSAWDIAIDDDGNIWAASASEYTFNGQSWYFPSVVSMFNGESWTEYTESDGLAAGSVSAVAIDHDGNKWFGTASGVVKYDGTNWTTYTVKDGLVSNDIEHIAVDSKGNIWFCPGGPTPAGVSRYDGNNWKTYTTKDGLASNRVQDIAVDKDGNVWFATDNGISMFGKGLPPGSLLELPLVVTHTSAQ